MNSSNTVEKTRVQLNTIAFFDNFGIQQNRQLKRRYFEPEVVAESQYFDAQYPLHCALPQRSYGDPSQLAFEVFGTETGNLKTSGLYAAINLRS